MSQTEPPIDDRQYFLDYLKKAYFNARTDVIGEQNGNLENSNHALTVLGFMADELVAHQDIAVKEARLTDNHDWDAESFKRQDVTVCRRCATTYQTRGNKPCKGKMAKITLRQANNTEGEADDK